MLNKREVFLSLTIALIILITSYARGDDDLEAAPPDVKIETTEEAFVPDDTTAAPARAEPTQVAAPVPGQPQRQVFEKSLEFDGSVIEGTSASGRELGTMTRRDGDSKKNHLYQRKISFDQETKETIREMRNR